MSQHNLKCHDRSLQRLSSKNCMVIDEKNDCASEMGLLFIEWSKRCNLPFFKLPNYHYGIQTCPTASRSVTPNIQKVTEIGNKVQQYCEAQSGNGTKCERESEVNRCFASFRFLEQRVYMLEGMKGFQYKFKRTADPECVK